MERIRIRLTKYIQTYISLQVLFELIIVRIISSVMCCGLTVLRARSEQVDNVFVFPDHLHHLHL